MATRVFDEILTRACRDLSRDEQAKLVSALTARLRASEAPSGAHQRQALLQLREELDALPFQNPDDGFSNREHDRLLSKQDRGFCALGVTPIRRDPGAGACLDRLHRARPQATSTTRWSIENRRPRGSR